MASLAVTLAEMLAFWKDYARDVVANAQALARALDAEGVPVLARDQGHTRSHLILFEPGTRDATEAVRLLEAAGLFATPVRLPTGSPLKGIRMGTASVTRRGMGTGEMAAIAIFVRRVVLDGEDPGPSNGTSPPWPAPSPRSTTASRERIMARLRLGVDIGGTFTDHVLFDEGAPRSMRSRPPRPRTTCPAACSTASAGSRRAVATASPAST